MTHALYTVALGLAVAGYAPAALWRRWAHGTPLHLRARLGWEPGAAPTTRAGWVHAVSVGEAMAAAPLLAGLRQLRPALPLVMTTVTDTGARVVRERYAGLVAHRFFPLDFPGPVRRAFDAIAPTFLICLETELWPTVFREAARRGVPVMVANGRVSDRSFRRYRLVRRALRPVLELVTVFAMRSEEDARRIIVLGAPPERVVVTGNIKHEAAAGSGGVELWRRLLGLGPGQPVWIAGSTHRGEEELVLDAHREALVDHPDLVLVLAPRHPERVPEVLGAVASRAFRPVRRSQLPWQASGGLRPVIVLDTVGELAQLYEVAEVVFVGGSLVDAGGHNVLEPAARRKPVLVGPHTANFREAVALLVAAGGAWVVRDARELAARLRALLADPTARAAAGAAAAEAVVARHGAVRATLELVERYLLAEAPA